MPTDPVAHIAPAARLRMVHAESRAACYFCGLRKPASIHGIIWWQHIYEPGILTRNENK